MSTPNFHVGTEKAPHDSQVPEFRYHSRIQIVENNQFPVLVGFDTTVKAPEMFWDPLVFR